MASPAGFSGARSRFRNLRVTWGGCTLGFCYSLFALNYYTTYHYTVHKITGPSMAPFLSPDYHEAAKKDWVVFKQNLRLEDEYPEEGGSGKRTELKRGMVVSFLSPTSGKLAVKRIVALGGDVVRPLGRSEVGSGAADRLHIPADEGREIVVPFGHVWVEGDQVDRNKNFDSNLYGPVSKSLIQGVATKIVWPMERTGLLRGEDGWEERLQGRVGRSVDEHRVPEEWRLY